MPNRPHFTHRFVFRVLSGAAALLLCGGLIPAGASAAGITRIPVLAAPAWTSHATPLETAPQRDSTSVTVYIRQPKAALAAAAAAAVSDPHNPHYRQFLSPTEYRAAYAPDDATVAAVRDFLSSAGLAVGPAPANRLSLRATGTVGQVDRAFATTLARYRHDGRTVTAPAVPLSLPGSIAPLVAGISGPDIDATGATIPTPAAAGITCSAYAGQHTAVLPAAYGRTVFPTAGCGYTPDQVHSAYQTTDLLAHGITGRGVRVAVLLFYPIPTVVSDIDRFSAAHGLPTLTPGQLTQVLPPSFVEPPPPICPLAADQQEAEGDLENAHTMAPGADLVYVAAASCTPEDILAATNTVVDNQLADVVSNSYTVGFADVSPAVVAAAHRTFVQAALEGIGLFYASGDFGDLSTVLPTPATTWPESDPMVTSVGGTSLFVGPGNTRLGEVGWGMTVDPVVPQGNGQPGYALPLPGVFAGGSGGGRTQYPQPDYQRGVVPPALAGATEPRRVVPDVSADADLATGVLVGITVNGSYVEGAGGGTSVSTPLFAGVEALADQAAGHPHGFVNPLLYLLHGAAILHDVVNQPYPLALAYARAGTTYLDTLQADTGLSATPGYDDQTGLGTPRGNVYVAALAGL
jgi:subtilase family serine protease